MPFSPKPRPQEHGSDALVPRRSGVVTQASSSTPTATRGRSPTTQDGDWTRTGAHTSPDRTESADTARSGLRDYNPTADAAAKLPALTPRVRATDCHGSTTGDLCSAPLDHASFVEP